MDLNPLPSIEPPVSNETDPEMTIKLPWSAAIAVVRLLYGGPFQQVAGILASIQDQLADQVFALDAFTRAAQAGATQPLSDAETTPPTISTSKH